LNLSVHFFEEIKRLASDAESARFLLAVSGGRDSVALAHLFATRNLHFDIAHCNFHLRSEESNKEMHFVQNLSFLTTQKVFVKEFDTCSVQEKSGKSMEMVARELRYQWFEEIGEAYHYIVTAHHANDNAETVILNMLRGTGMRGICGIPQKNGKIIRPLLKVSAYSIEQYLQKQKVQYCVDSSNLSDQFMRNKIRHHIIPELEKIYPKVIDTFTKNSRLLQQQTQFFDAHIQLYKTQLWQETEDRITINIKTLTENPFSPIILYEILNPLGFNADDIENILKSTNTHSGKRFFSNTHILIKDRTHFIIERKTEKKAEDMLIYSMEELENHGFSVEKKLYDAPFDLIKKHNLIYVDAAKLTFPLSIRGWKKGDVFSPFGMKTKKKVSDFFTDSKIDLLEKQKIRLLLSGKEIVWVINYRADERFKIDADTKWYYKITLNLKP